MAAVAGARAKCRADGMPPSRAVGAVAPMAGERRALRRRTPHGGAKPQGVSKPVVSGTGGGRCASVYFFDPSRRFWFLASAFSDFTRARLVCTSLCCTPKHTTTAPPGFQIAQKNDTKKFE